MKSKCKNKNAVDTQQDEMVFMSVSIKHRDNKEIYFKRFNVRKSYYNKCVGIACRSYRNVRWRKLFLDYIKRKLEEMNISYTDFRYEYKAISIISSMNGAKLNISLRNHDVNITKEVADKIWDEFIELIRSDIDEYEKSVKAEDSQEGGRNRIESIIRQHSQTHQHSQIERLYSPVEEDEEDETTMEDSIRQSLASLLNKYKDPNSTIIISQIIFILASLEKLPLDPRVREAFLNRISRFINGYFNEKIDTQLFDYFVKEFTHDLEGEMANVSHLNKYYNKVAISTWVIMQNCFGIYR